MKRFILAKVATLLTGIFMTLPLLLPMLWVDVSSAQAALGDKEPISSASDRSAMSSTDAAVRTGTFTVKEIRSNSVPVREYINKEGTVFGLAWKGRNQPDFSALLGTFYGEYQAMNAKRESGVHARGSRRSMQSDHLVVQKFGHMGALRGRAFVPALMPAGVQSNEIN